MSYSDNGDTTHFAPAEIDLIKAMAIADKMDDPNVIIPVYLAMGECLKGQHRDDEGLGFGLKALQLARKNEDLYGIAESYMYIFILPTIHLLYNLFIVII